MSAKAFAGGGVFRHWRAEKTMERAPRRRKEKTNGGAELLLDREW